MRLRRKAADEACVQGGVKFRHFDRWTLRVRSEREQIRIYCDSLQGRV